MVNEKGKTTFLSLLLVIFHSRVHVIGYREPQQEGNRGKRLMNSNISLRYTIEFNMIKSKIWYGSDFANECPDEFRIAAYMSYLGRFYNIAENNISEKVREYLNSTFSDMDSNRDFKKEKYIQNIYNMTMKTLPDSKQKAILELDSKVKLLELCMLRPYSGPSLSYAETSEVSKKSGDGTISTFVYDWSINNSKITEKLKIPFFSPHVLLVPLSIAFMTQFTINILNDEKSIPLFAKMINVVNARVPSGDRKYHLKISDICTQYKLL